MLLSQPPFHHHPPRGPPDLWHGANNISVALCRYNSQLNIQVHTALLKAAERLSGRRRKLPTENMQRFLSWSKSCRDFSISELEVWESRNTFSFLNPAFFFFFFISVFTSLQFSSVFLPTKSTRQMWAVCRVCKQNTTGKHLLKKKNCSTAQLVVRKSTGHLKNHYFN